MQVRVLSLDLSSSRTGWAFIDCGKGASIKYGTIPIKATNNPSRKLAIFRKELEKVLSEHRPTHVVIEDVYSRINIKTYGVLSKYVGVAQELCYDLLEVDPHIMSTNTTKAFYKVKDKQHVFDFLVDLLDLKDMNYKNDNDVTDAAAQLLCYCDKGLFAINIRTETNYGFVYEVENA